MSVAQLVEQVRRSEGEERNQRPQFAAHLDTLFLAHDSTSLSQVTLAHCWRHAPLSGSAFSDQGLANLRKTFFCMHFSALRSPSQSTLSPQTAHALAFVLSLFQVRLSMPFCYKFRHFILHFVYISSVFPNSSFLYNNFCPFLYQTTIEFLFIPVYYDVNGYSSLRFPPSAMC